MKLVHVFMATSLTFISAMSFASGLSFSDLDTDHDGVISVKEAKANTLLTAQFAKLDADKDKLLSRSEFLNFQL
ncbi:calmodulin [Pseudoalteromonas citrea]|uniref:Calmodulin n=1 Tax=Pseudoalteromonas citrea TaxID=43655 RepID=A0A5S3XQV5_9GAMM|nr:EF-hand domain-containing protein [Pseudoalteromonas citrea]TMP41047.1 calmodulin [Pseudoalteromonas citrea]TMP60113.1 calmodulin [Pseudoalteromonas citrea]